MGNGQHRNRRGSRPRPAPHKHGGAGNPGRATTQLIPPVAPASATGSDTSTDSGADDDTAAWEEVIPAVPATPGVSEDLATDVAVEADQDALPAAQSETRQQHHHRRRGSDHTPPPALVVATPSEEFAAEGVDVLSQSSATPSNRGRFDRFYAPGQGSRGERAERIAPPISPALPAVSAPPRRDERRDERVDRAERAERAPAVSPVSEPQNASEDDGPDYTGPRSDVRGSVAELIDSLHEVFERDRNIASQGGVARCGVCYLHFPVGELTYRDVEGFYVCESCAHALGATRVPMVRRQQRQ